MTMHAVKDLVTLYTASTYRFFCPACLAKQVQTEIVLIYPLQPKACHICGALFQMIPPVVVEIADKE